VLYHVNGVPGAVRGEPSAKADGGASRSRPRGRKRRGAALRRLEAQPNAGRGIEQLTAQEIADVAASFQAAVVDVLRIKLRRAARQTAAPTLILGGGVAANGALREALAALAGRLHATLRMPEMRYCVDNAAMTAGLAWHYLQAGKVDDLSLAARATVRR